MGRQRSFYRIENVLVATAICTTVAISLIFMSDDGANGSSGAAPSRVVVLAIAALFLIGAVRAATMRLVIRPDGVRVRNLVRSYRWPLSAVSGVVHSRYGFGAFPSVAVRLEDGRERAVTALLPPNPGFRPNHQSTAMLVEQANAEVLRLKEAQRRAEGRPTTPP